MPESFLALSSSEKSFKTAIIEGRHISGILKAFGPGFARIIAEAEDAIDEPSSDPLMEGENIGGGEDIRGDVEIRDGEEVS